MRGDITLFPEVMVESIKGELMIEEIDCWLMLLRGPVFSQTLESINNPFALETSPGPNYKRGGIHLGYPVVNGVVGGIELRWSAQHTWYPDPKRDRKLRPQIVRWGLIYAGSVNVNLKAPGQAELDVTRKRIAYVDIGPEELDLNTSKLSISLGTPAPKEYRFLERAWRWLNGMKE